MIASPSLTQQLWEDFRGRLWQFIRSRVAEEALAEDILQTVFLRVHERFGEVRDETRLVSWLFQITRNVIIDTYRQHQPVPLPEEAADTLVSPAEEFPTVYQLLVPCLYGLLPCLSPQDQEAIRLGDLDGLPQGELAIRWGVSLSGAKSRIQRARERLKARLISGCHLEINHSGRLVDFSDGCTCCVESCTPAASFGALTRPWKVHASCTSSPLRSTDMDTTETTPAPAATSTTISPTGGFTKPVTIPVTAANSTSCCGSSAPDGGNCCGEPVSQVTDTTVSGTASCCGETASTGGSCCN